MNVSHLIHKKTYETMIEIYRRHPITFVTRILIFLLLTLIPVAVYLLVKNVTPSFTTTAILYPLFVIMSGIYYLSIYLFFFAWFIDFYLDMWIVTNDRIVDVEQFGLFSRTISELDLFQIQDITTDVRGFFATIFNYGNVTVKTASTNENIVFRNVKDPNTLRQKILHYAHIDRKFHFLQPSSTAGTTKTPTTSHS